MLSNRWTSVTRRLLTYAIHTSVHAATLLIWQTAACSQTTAIGSRHDFVVYAHRNTYAPEPELPYGILGRTFGNPDLKFAIPEGHYWGVEPAAYDMSEQAWTNILLDLSTSETEEISFSGLRFRQTTLPIGALDSLRKCRNLRRLRIHPSDESLPELIRALAQMPALEQLDVSFCSATSTEVSELQSLKRLRSLNVSNTKVGADAATAIFSLRALEALNVSGCNISGELLRNHPNPEILKSLRMSSNSLCDPAFFTELRRFSNLEELDISRTRASNGSLKAIFEINSLRHLNVGNSDVSCDEIAQMPDKIALQSVDLAHIPVDGTVIRRLGRCHNLKSLSLEGCVGVNDEDISRMMNVGRLEVVDLSHTAISDAVMGAFENSESLRSLSVDHTAIGDTGISKLRGCTQLRRLSLAGCKITTASISELRHCRELTELDLSQCELGEGVADAIGSRPKLRLLFLTETPAGDAEIVKLVENCPNLEYFLLSGCQVSDAGVSAMGKLSRLEFCDISNCGKISPNGARELKRFKSLRTLLITGSERDTVAKAIKIAAESKNTLEVH